jgi:tetratricopeptide (TPR) repeat protein
MSVVSSSRALLSAVVALVACAPPADLDRARHHLRSGELRRACVELRALVDRPAARRTSLSTLRSWIDCLARSGELDVARRYLASRPNDGARFYGEALVEVSGSPAALPRALKLLEEAGRRWPDQAEIPYRAAVLLLADEQPSAALPLLERSCRVEDTAACAVALAHALLDLDRAPEALAAAARVPQLQPERTDVARGRALIQRVMRRTRSVPASARVRYQQLLELVQRQEKAAETVRLAREILVDHPRLGPVHLLLGLGQLRLGNAGEAVVALRRAAELLPLEATGHLYLAVIHQSRGRLEESVNHFREALRRDPFLGQAALQLGELQLRLRRPREAALALDRAVALDGGSSRLLRLSGRAHLAAGDLDPAERSFSRLLQREPRDFEAHLRLAQILLRRGRSRELVERAAVHARQAAAVRPGDSEVEQVQQLLGTTR